MYALKPAFESQIYTAKHVPIVRTIWKYHGEHRIAFKLFNFSNGETHLIKIRIIRVVGTISISIMDNGGNMEVDG